MTLQEFFMTRSDLFHGLLSLEFLKLLFLKDPKTASSLLLLCLTSLTTDFLRIFFPSFTNLNPAELELASRSDAKVVQYARGEREAPENPALP